MGMNMSTLLGQALVLGNQVVRFLPWRCLYPWVLGFLTGSCYNGCMMLSECGCSHNEGRCIKDASIGLGFQVALFLPWLRQHGSTRHRGANVGLGIQMVFFVCFLLVFLSHGVCKSPYISIHRALQQRYCHEMWPCGTASMYAICKHVCRTSGPHFVVQWSFLLLPLPTCLHRGDDDMFAAAWRVSVQRQHGKSQIHGGASKAAVWFRPSGAQACLQHAHVDRSDCCLEVAKQLAIIVTIRGGW